MGFLLAIFLIHQVPNTGKTLVFEENLRITAPEGTVWYGSQMGLDVDDSGKMYVSDPKNGLIYGLDSDGSVFKVAGGKGQGPDQLPGLAFVKVLNDGRVVAVCGLMGAVRLHFFDGKLNFLQKTDYPGVNAYGPLDLSYHLKVLGAAVRKAGDTYKGTLELLDMTGGTLTVLDQVERGLPGRPQSTMGDQFVYGVKTFLQRADAGGGLLRMARDGSVFTAHTNQYRITRWDEALTESTVIEGVFQKRRRDLRLVERFWMEYVGVMPLAKYHTLDVFEKGMDQAQLKPFFPAILEMIPMDQGGLLVVKWFNPETGDALGDVFSKNGGFVCETRLPPSSFSMLGGVFRFQPKMVFRNQQAYVLEEVDDFEFVLVRYNYGFSSE